MRLPPTPAARPGSSPPTPPRAPNEGHAKKSNVAAAIAAATLATAALASPAFAELVAPLDSNGHEFTFGDYGSCVRGDIPGTPFELDWNESANGASVRPQVKGDLCLQNTNAEARVAIVYHNAATQTITKSSSSPATGNGGPLSAYFVNEIGPRVSKAIVDHVHVQIEERNLAGGWDDVSGAEAVLPVP